MFTALRRRGPSAADGIQLCESCGRVSTAADRARARLDHTRTQLALLNLPR